MTNKPTWEYRIIRRKERGSVRYDLRQVYWDEYGDAWVSSTPIISSTLNKLIEELTLMMEALDKPIIDEDEEGIKFARWDGYK